jgi:hypothetical protein
MVSPFNLLAVGIAAMLLSLFEKAQAKGKRQPNILNKIVPLATQKVAGTKQIHENFRNGL